MRRLAVFCVLCLLCAGCTPFSSERDGLTFDSPVAGFRSEGIRFSGMEQEFCSFSAAAQPLTVFERRQTDGYTKWWDSEFSTASGGMAQIQFLFDIRSQCSCTIYDGHRQYSINSTCGSPLGLYRADLNLDDDAVDVLYWERLSDGTTQIQIFRYDGERLYIAGRLSGAPGDVFTDGHGVYVCESTDLISFTEPRIAVSYYRESGYILAHPPTQMDKTAFGQTFFMRAGRWYFDTETRYDPNTLESYETAYLANGRDAQKYKRIFTGNERVTLLNADGSNTIYYCEIDGVRGALCLFE